MPGKINSRITTKKLALSGILAAFSVVLLILESIVPTGRLGFYVLTSFFTAVVIIESNLFYAWIFYVVVSVLAFVFIPEKISVAPYVLFFGLYAIIKNYVERIRNIVVIYLLKIVFFNIVLIVSVKFINTVFIDLSAIKIPNKFLLIVFQILFIVYDRIFSMFIDYYYSKISSLNFH